MAEYPLRVLITGAGAPGIKGTLHALYNNPDGRKIHPIGVDARDNVAGKAFVKKFFKIPYPEESNYAQRLLDVCKNESIDIIIPQTTRETVVLSELKKWFELENVKVMAANPKSIETANNKNSLLSVFKELKLPYPMFYLTKSEEDLVECAHRLGYPKSPVVVKPPVSNGMRGFRILRKEAWDTHRFLNEKPSGVEISLESLLAILRRGNEWPDILVTEYLSGPEYSVDAFRGSKCSVAIPRIRDAIRSGISFENTIDFNQEIMDYTLLASDRLQLQYAFGFQFKLDKNGIPKVLECNPRIQGTMVASVFTGVNVIWLGVKELLGEPPVASFSKELNTVKFCRFWGGVAFKEGKTYEI